MITHNGTVHASDETAPQTREALRHVRQETGLEYQIAHALDVVLEAWRLVYRSYLRSGLIAPNPQELHTVPEAVGPHATVVVGRIGPVVASTISAYHDRPEGLPLDTVYGAELAALRDQGRRLCEVGLFADRREHLSRSANSLFELMRFAFFHALHGRADDIIIGVHPHHVPFYTRLIGFVQAGELRRYSTVNNHLVVLLRLDLHQWTPDDAKLPRGLRHFFNNPVPAEWYDHRYRFTPGEVQRSALGAFLDAAAGHGA